MFESVTEFMFNACLHPRNWNLDGGAAHTPCRIIRVSSLLFDILFSISPPIIIVDQKARRRFSSFNLLF